MDLKVKPVTALFLQKNLAKVLASGEFATEDLIKGRDRLQIQVKF